MKRGVFAGTGLAAIVLTYTLSSLNTKPTEQGVIYSEDTSVNSPLKKKSIPSFQPTIPSFDEKKYIPLVGEQNVALYSDIVLATKDNDNLNQILLSSMIEGLPQRYTCLVPDSEGTVFLRDSVEDVQYFRKILKEQGKDASFLDRLSLEEDCFEHPYYELFNQNPTAQRFRHHLGNYFIVRQTLREEQDVSDVAFTEENIASYYANVLSYDLILLAQQPMPSDAQHSFLFQALKISDFDREASEKISAWYNLFGERILSF